MKHYLPTLCVLVFALMLLGEQVEAQSTQTSNIGPQIISGGGGQQSTQNYYIHNSIEYSTDTTFKSNNYAIYSGFLSTAIIANIRGDVFETDNTCGNARPLLIGTDPQSHTFHRKGDVDWLRFSAPTKKTYIVTVNNVSPKSDAVIDAYDICDGALSGSEQKSFGNDANEVVFYWNIEKVGDKFLKIRQFDGTTNGDDSKYGDDVKYTLSITLDTAAPESPTNLRCVSINETTIAVQWQKGTDSDLAQYVLSATRVDNSESRNLELNDPDKTFGEFSGLANGKNYNITARAVDFSGNVSNPSVAVQCTPQKLQPTTPPVITVQAPSSSSIISTTSSALTFSGMVNATSANLGRVKVTNTRNGKFGWDYSLSGSSDSFRVENLSIEIGDNPIKIEAADDADNKSEKSILIKRLAVAQGGALIVVGHDDIDGLQSNIYNMANRAYRILLSAGLQKSDILYVAPVQQDADMNGAADDVDVSPADPVWVEQSIKTWSATHNWENQSLFVYFVDHGEPDKFCLDGCEDAGIVTAATVNSWITQLEATTVVTRVNVVIEACKSGSFITRASATDPNSLSKRGRVIITSTSHDKNAYASVDGGLFSDVFFSCVADSLDLKTCFEQGKAAIATTKLMQAPQMDDNGDGIYNNGDGTFAQERFVTHFFGSLRPQIINAGTLELSGETRTLFADVRESAEAIDIVWAAIYPPHYSEPADVTLELNVPTVKLEDPDGDGRYEFNYVKGFTEPETPNDKYRIVFYAQDKKDIHAIPFGEFGDGGRKLFLPLVTR